MNTTAAAIRMLIASDESRYAPLLHKAQRDSRHLCDTFRDRPEWISGWGHQFACPACTSHLTFDFDLDFTPPNAFICPNCGKTAVGQAFDEAWVYYYRLQVSSMLESAAVCAVLGDEDALAFLTRYFDFYSAHYEGFAIHGEGNGKVMPQVLDEAVWCINILRAFYPCRSLFPAEKKQRWYEKLFMPLSALVNAPEIQTSIHNHVLWHKSAVGAIAVCFEDDALLSEVLDGHLGIREQAARGFTADGLWHEGSPLYHYYALEALTGFCQFFAEKHPDDPLVALLERTHLSALKLSCDGWTIPSINDGWYPLPLSRFADQFHRAAAASGSAALQAQADRIRSRCPQAIDVPASLLIDPAPAAVELWESTRLAIFRHPLHAILKSGVLVRSHKHRDNLSVILPPFSNDLGTPGYGHALYRGWYQLSASHNTIAVDGTQPPFVIPTHVEALENGAVAVVDEGWEGVLSARRTLKAEGGSLHDRTEILCDGEHVIDWLFHAEGEAVFSAEPGEEATLGDYPGYEHFRDVRRIDCEKLTVSFALDGRTLTLEAGTEGMQVFAARSPGNPADMLRTSLILRVRGDRAVFDVSYR